MDRITQSLLQTFKSEQSLQDVDTSIGFEHFANYCVILSEHADSLNIDDVWVGGGDDTALDGIAIFVNGALVTSTEEVEDLAQQNQFIDATFVFVQAKTSEKFDTADFGNFAFGVKDFFSVQPQLRRNERVQEAASISDFIFQRASLM